eukprot:m.107146 g.107146  ORF g.107146 m.107146 type:complete len:204 (+) comp15832_c0_seq5:63-674(+)
MSFGGKGCLLTRLALFLCQPDLPSFRLIDATLQNKQAWLRIVGIGLGQWAIDATLQSRILLEVYWEVINRTRLAAVSDVEFCWFPDEGKGSVFDAGSDTCGAPAELSFTCGNTVRVHFGKTDTASPLPPHAAGKLLVAQYAWDGNAYPGNEYWGDDLDASGDPAAACCSTIGELHNGDVNVRVGSQAAVLWDQKGSCKHAFAS